MRITVVSWDLGHNALGRAYVLADMLAASHDVEIVGSHFPEFGHDVWPPLRGSVTVRSYPGGGFPEYFRTMEEMAAGIRADVVYAIKPRLPSLGVGLLARSRGEGALVVDSDDLELSFVAARRGLSPGELPGLCSHPDFLRPQGQIWTRFCEDAVSWADAVTVASIPLAARYRGTVIPHARDERVFDPALYDRDEARALLGLGPHERGVLFAGTPRRHKGIHRAATALARIGDRRNRLLVFATPELDEVRPLLAGLEQWVHPVPPPPFPALPSVLSGADLVCVLQDPDSESAQWQMPAKITDALAMGIPCLATPTPPVLPLIDDGAIAGANETELAPLLQTLLDDPSSAAKQAARGRELFLRRFSYSAVRPRLEAVVQEAGATVGCAPADLVSAVAFQRSAFTSPEPPSPAVDETTQVHDAVGSVLPKGAGPIAVVSRGDTALIHFDAHEGWHFPQNDDGAYAGHYPADSDAAIRQLEDVRRRGARYLLVPSSSSWWLDHYVGFRDYLTNTYQSLDASQGISALYALRAPGGSQ